jgi:CHAT domain-containing protein
MQSTTLTDANERLAACEGLYRLIIEPLRLKESDPLELIVMPDGALHYVPFAALRDSESPTAATYEKQYLVQRFDLAVAPALRHVLSVDSAQPRTPRSTNNRMLLIADPVYTENDSRVSGGLPVAAPMTNVGTALVQGVPDAALTSLAALTDSSRLKRLESTGREAQAITSVYGQSDVDLLIGLDATRDRMLGSNLASYRFVHVASHGLMDSTVPQLSALILGRFDRRGPVGDPYIRTSDLLEQTFTAQAVVLSACDTALGKEFPTEGVIGLRYAALARGAHTVVASLWAVSDGITATLMTSMYGELRRGAPGTAGPGRESGTLESDANDGGEPVVKAMSVALRRALAERPRLDPALWGPFVVYIAGH